MTPEEIAKEQEASKSNPIKPASIIEQISVAPTELKTPKAIDKTPPAESDREYSGKVKDYKTIVSEAKSKSIDLNNQEGELLLDKDKKELSEKISKAVPKERLSDALSRLDIYSPPELKKVPELDQKRLMDQERKIRRARWADALYAFGEGLQGRVANPETFATTALQRKKDKEFQNYLDITNKNRDAKNAWIKYVTDDTIKWLDEQANNERIDARERAKYQQLADKYKADLAFKEKDLAQKKDIADAANKNRINVAAIRASATDKTNKPVTVKTAQQTYELKPEEAEFYKGQFINNIEKFASQYPGTIVKLQITNRRGYPLKGQYKYEITKPIKDSDMIRSVLEEEELNERRNFTSGLFDKANTTQSQKQTQPPSQGQTKKLSIFQ